MENSFAVQQLMELAAPESKLKFIRRAAEKYDFPEGTAARILRECDLIAARMNDTRLKIAVVGEFSSGKSSFINALLREELLETDVLQGTTVLSAMIYYSGVREITVFGKDGCGEHEVYENADAFRERIRQLNRDTDENSDISRAEIGLPSELLKRGICIIDTPGTNSVNVWHDETTRRIIREQADGCIVLTGAVAPMPASLCGFIGENLCDMLSECVFIVTKYDLVKENERQRLMDFISQKIETEFELTDPLALPYSSLDILNGGVCAEISHLSEEKIIETLSAHKFAIQRHRILSLIRQTLGVLSENMRCVSEAMEHRRDALEQASAVDLDEFVSGELSVRSAEFDERFTEISRDFEGKLAALCTQEASALNNKLNSLNTGDEIVKFYKGLSAELEGVGTRVLVAVGAEGGSAPTVFGDVEKMCGELISKFESDLTVQYPTLTLLANEDKKCGEVKFKTAGSWNTNFTANASLTKNVLADEKKDGIAVVAGWGSFAAAGAAVGSIIPGIGTAAGLIGGIVVGIFAAGKISDSPKRAKKLREKTAADYAAVKQRFFQELKSDLTGELKKYGSACRAKISVTAGEYLRFYKDAVREITERDREERRLTEQHIEELNADIRKLRTFIDETEEILRYPAKGELK